MGALITGSGSYIPDQVRLNMDFADAEFYNGDRQRLDNDTAEIIGKFEKITGIAQRRYANDQLNASDLAALAADATCLALKNLNGQQMARAEVRSLPR